MAIIIFINEGPSKAVIVKGRINGGKAKKPSVIRIKTVSKNPPLNPAIIPIGTPIKAARITTPKPTKKEDFAAIKVIENKSRPNESVPKGYKKEGG
jgi:hypothetical protein